MKKKMDNVKRHVGGKFFTIERKVRNTTARYCAKLVSESAQYLTITDVNTGEQHKMNKNSVVALNCGQFSV
jgi:hypothetical protein